MALKTRIELESFFKNGTLPSQVDFADLIASTLNKRDDQFHGRWRTGTTYRHGDVVVYGRALWELDLGDPEAAICSEHPPPDEERWRSLIVPVEDDDWVMVEADSEDSEAGTPALLYTDLRFARTGVGTGAPRARQDVREPGTGRFLIFPAATDVAALHLASESETDEEETYLLTALDAEQVAWTSDAPGGFIFRRGEPPLPASGDADSSDETLDETAPDDAFFPDYREGDVLLVLQPDVDRQVRVGVGTERPSAMLDVTDGRKGQLRFQPDDKEDPAVTIVNLDPKTARNYLTTGVGAEQAASVTDAPGGFVFKQGAEYDAYCSAPDVGQGEVLMVVQMGEDGVPRVGIGTGEPEAVLDVTDGEAIRFTLGGDENGDPVFTITALDAEPGRGSITASVAEEQAALKTGAPKGFAFYTGDPSEDESVPRVVITGDGRVGIGTEDPHTRLEVTNGESGRFLFNLDRKVNPALGIVNTRPGSAENYVASGVDNDSAIFVTDSELGFVFKKGDPAGTGDHEIDVNQGETLVSVIPEGEDGTPATTSLLPGGGLVGVGMDPENYHLDVDGLVRAFNVYSNTDEKKVVEEAEMDSVRARIQKLRPVTFHWSPDTGLDGEGEQIGLLAHEVGDVFPQVVRTNRDRTKAVAYPALVPVLVKAVQEQQDLIDGLQERLDALEDRLAAVEDTL
jgi:hypothetical protein